MGGTGSNWPREITFDFPGGDTYSNSILWPSGERQTITGGLNGDFYINHFGSALMAWRGYWRDGHTFSEEQNFDLQADADIYTVSYTFDGNKVSITVDSGMGAFPTLKGGGAIAE
jgi:hypothetical protein